MQIDKTTYEDLSIFNHEEEFSVFHKLNFTRTRGGRDWLFHYFNNPFSDLKHIIETQNILNLILASENEWPLNISNGTIMVMERFYETAMDEIPFTQNIISAFTYKILHGPDYSITRYSVEHFIDFVHGMNKMASLFDNENSPPLLRSLIERIKFLLSHDIIHSLLQIKPKTKLTVAQNVYYGHYIRYRFKNYALDLIAIYGKLDAWYSMAVATKTFGFALPEFN
ncbi:MAG: DNA mismatch repair protein MutS, partial [Bacteroidota bacterium]